MENNTKAFNRIASFATPYFEGEKELVKRVNFVKTVIQNTLRKFPTELHPEELSWAKTGNGVRLTGFDFRDSKDKAVEITADNPITHNLVLSFYIIGKKNWTSNELTVRHASIPADLLFNDPMAISQYARKLVRAKQTQLRTQESIDTDKKVAEVDKQIAKLEQDRAKLEHQKTEIRTRNQLARETINKNRAKQEKRQAAKLLKTNP